MQKNLECLSRRQQDESKKLVVVKTALSTLEVREEYDILISDITAPAAQNDFVSLKNLL